MKIRVILSRENASWIIGKMAERLVGELARFGAAATLGQEPDETADVNHWMSYAHVSRRAGQASTMFITHIDDPYKTSHLQVLLRESVDVGLCMSRDMMRALISWGVPKEGLWYVLPAFDSPPEPSRIRIAITTRLYPDGRKRESLLQRLASDLDLSPFHFEIAGSGWESVVEEMRDAGASVSWSPGQADYQADYAAMLEAVRGCEYYLYLGMDEGSLGTLDALALGLKTIVTPQGFHLDIPGGITEPVETYEQLRDTLVRLAQERESRMSSVRGWSWAEYAQDHLRVWSALLEGGRAGVAAALEGQGRYAAASSVPGNRGLAQRTWSGYYKRVLSPSRVLDALALSRVAQPLRRLLRRMR